jgi:hypothetical protein
MAKKCSIYDILYLRILSPEVQAGRHSSSVGCPFFAFLVMLLVKNRQMPFKHLAHLEEEQQEGRRKYA